MIIYLQIIPLFFMEPIISIIFLIRKIHIGLIMSVTEIVEITN